MDNLNNKLKKLPSNKQFGYFFSIVFFILGTYFYIKLNFLYISIFLTLSISFFVISFFKPNILKPLNYSWMRLGNFLSKIFSPIILAIIYFLIFTPMSLIFRIFGREGFSKYKSDSTTFWIESDKNKILNFKQRF